MTEPALFEVTPWREATAADLKVGDWIKGFAWPWSWKCVISTRVTESGHVSIDTADTAGGALTGSSIERAERPIRVYNGTPPAEECGR